MAQLRVFLSHSSADKAFADRLVAALRAAGADVWYDEHNLGMGQLRSTIMRELATRPVFIVLVSHAALTSRWVQDECEWAYNIGQRKPERPMLSVVAAPYVPDDWDALLFIESLHRLETSDHRPFPVEEAISRTLRLLELTPPGQAHVAAVPREAESVDDLLTKGQALVAQKRYDEGLTFFERATHVEPDNQSAWFNLGHALLMMECHDASVVAFNHAIACDPDEPYPYVGKALALRGLRLESEALVAVERALEIDPSDAFPWDIKGNLLFALGRLDEALAALDRALALDPTLPDTEGWHAEAQAAAPARDSSHGR